MYIVLNQTKKKEFRITGGCPGDAKADVSGSGQVLGTLNPVSGLGDYLALPSLSHSASAVGSP